MPEDVEKNEGKKMLKIVSKILDLNLNKGNQQGRRLKILTPNMLNRWPISSAQLKAGNNSELHKFKLDLTGNLNLEDPKKWL